MFRFVFILPPTSPLLGAVPSSLVVEFRAVFALPFPPWPHMIAPTPFAYYGRLFPSFVSPTRQVSLVARCEMRATAVAAFTRFCFISVCVPVSQPFAAYCAVSHEGTIMCLPADTPSPQSLASFGRLVKMQGKTLRISGLPFAPILCSLYLSCEIVARLRQHTTTVVQFPSTAAVHRHFPRRSLAIWVEEGTFLLFFLV